VLDHDRIPEADPRTWARITTLESNSPDDLERALRRIVDQVIPISRELPGWKGALALATESRRRGFVVTFWDSVENLVSSGRTAGEFRGAGERAGMDVVSNVERLEIVLDERIE